MDALLVWLVLLMLFLGLGYALGRRRAGATSMVQARREPVSPETMAGFEHRVSAVMSVRGRSSRDGLLRFEGRLLDEPDAVITRLKDTFQAEGLTPLLQEGKEGEAGILLLPVAQVAAAADESSWRLPLLLFGLTVLTTTWAGALHAGVNLLQEPERFAVGLPYSIGLLLILGSHELGHYFAARWHGVRVTLPYFVPVPFALGTFGAFIRIKEFSPNRRAVFDVAVAGPLAGLVFAIPALFVGIGKSTLIVGNAAAEAGPSGVQVGSSFLMAILAKLVLGVETLQGHQLMLHPLAFAGWLGLLVTALNLLPIGQLDGGHLAHALFGARRGHTISVVGLVVLFALALFVWPGLMMWAFVVWFVAGTRDAPPLNDLTPLSFGRKALGVFSFLLLGLILIPVPHAFYPAMGIHCPYL